MKHTGHIISQITHHFMLIQLLTTNSQFWNKYIIQLQNAFQQIHAANKYLKVQNHFMKMHCKILVLMLILNTQTKVQMSPSNPSLNNPYNWNPLRGKEKIGLGKLLGSTPHLVRMWKPMLERSFWSWLTKFWTN